MGMCKADINSRLVSGTTSLLYCSEGSKCCEGKMTVIIIGQMTRLYSKLWA